jgi:hypothetical protein
MKWLIVSIALALIAESTTVALADDTRYRPQVSGKPAGVLVGTLVDYGQGMASGGLTVRAAGGKSVAFYTAAQPFIIDGKTVACPSPPRPPLYRRNADVCFHWPAYVKLGVTRISVPYWTGTRYGKPTLIARGLTVLK